MKVPSPALWLALFLGSPLALPAQERLAPGSDGRHVSLRLEIERAIEKGLAYLKNAQAPDSGAWGHPDQPAFTALAISAFLGDPQREPGHPLPAEVERGYAYLLSNVQPDGGIYRKGLATYNTALSIMALLPSGKPEHLPVIAKARHLLIAQQQKGSSPGSEASLFDGGIGYGNSYKHSDLSNTHFALEALYYSKQRLADTPYDESHQFDLDWDAAIEFVSLTQNSEATVRRLGEGYTLREEDRGGFVYFPGNTKSEEIELATPTGTKVALRSYGSMSYAGLLSFIYAEMDREDPRVLATLDWLQRHYTLEENPGMQAQGLYYYYHTMAKALALLGAPTLRTASGRQVDWRQELALKLMAGQRPDGSWLNEQSNRWMEGESELVTCYALLALQHIHRQL